MGSILMELNEELLNTEYETLEERLIDNAKWHKICFNKFSNLKLQRAQERRKSKTPCPGESSTQSKK